MEPGTLGPVAQEAEAGELLEPRSSRLWALDGPSTTWSVTWGSLKTVWLPAAESVEVAPEQDFVSEALNMCHLLTDHLSGKRKCPAMLEKC